MADPPADVELKPKEDIIVFFYIQNTRHPVFRNQLLQAPGQMSILSLTITHEALEYEKKKVEDEKRKIK